MVPQPTGKIDPTRVPITAETGESPVRCQCGSLVAKIVAGGLELKCRRCKRQIVVPLNLKGKMEITI